MGVTGVVTTSYIDRSELDPSGRGITLSAAEAKARVGIEHSGG